MVATEQSLVSWPAEWDVLTNELKRYEYEYTSTGTLRYNAPSGYHDDFSNDPIDCNGDALARESVGNGDGESLALVRPPAGPANIVAEFGPADGADPRSHPRRIGQDPI